MMESYETFNQQVYNIQMNYQLSIRYIKERDVSEHHTQDK